MRGKRFSWAPIALIFVSCTMAMAAPVTEMPDFAKKVLQAGSGQSGASTMVTLQQFKEFKLSLEFDMKDAEAPAPMTEREATDYATFVGKTIGKDLYWQELPPNEVVQRKMGGLGYLLYIREGMNIDLSNAKPFSPQIPPGMVYVPEGPFTMGDDYGDPDESPAHKTSAGPFFIDKLEVSNAEFKAAFPEFSFEAGREECPAIVTWEQAAAYATKCGKRLPTEIEWEKAARGVDGRIFPWGNAYDPAFVIRDESLPRGAATACPPSPYAALDMAGSAWEWTADWYQPYENNSSPSEDYGETYKVIRGGGCQNDIALLRASQRSYLPPNTTARVRVGFRCVKDLDEPKRSTEESESNP